MSVHNMHLLAFPTINNIWSEDFAQALEDNKYCRTKDDIDIATRSKPKKPFVCLTMLVIVEEIDQFSHISSQCQDFFVDGWDHSNSHRRPHLFSALFLLHILHPIVFPLHCFSRSFSLPLSEQSIALHSLFLRYRNLLLARK